MFENFDPRLLDDPEFKEDSVREVIIAPMLSRLGYHASGTSRVIRSKSLVHPFIYIGTRKHPVTIIPDYTLIHEEKPILILDAKSPTESVLSVANLQQAYSYAYHPEIKCKHFALCNGRSLAVFSMDHAEPLLIVNFSEFESKWSTIEQFLTPRYLLEPHLRNFDPDLGTKFSRLGLTAGSDVVMVDVRLNLFGRVSDALYTASTAMAFGEELHIATFDFGPEFLAPILAGLHPQLAEAFSDALSRQPFSASAGLVVEVDLAVKLGEETQGESESFVPFVVTKVLDARFNPAVVESGRADDTPTNVFKLRDAFTIHTAEDANE